MPRRAAYTKVEKKNRLRASHVKGMSDVAFKGFQCLNHNCRHFIFVRKDNIIGAFDVECPDCHQHLRSGEESKFFDYDLKLKSDNSIIESGEFKVLHDDYLAEAQEYKYCIYCNAMKPLQMFDQHSSRKQTGRQGECNLCKTIYNSIKNQTRLSDQHREAAQKRRLYMDLCGGSKIDSKAIIKSFSDQCFSCGKNLSLSPDERALDHTLSVYYLWPLTTATATLLCRSCNGNKAQSWPSVFYSDAKRKRLSVITGIEYDLLSGPATYNPAALDLLRAPKFVDDLLAKYSAYMDELIKLRNRILRDTGLDFFQTSKTISRTWVDKADLLL